MTNTTPHFKLVYIERREVFGTEFDAGAQKQKSASLSCGSTKTTATATSDHTQRINNTGAHFLVSSPRQSGGSPAAKLFL